jgi:tetrahydromethanopterin S-methyltransferase subunit E
VSISIATASPWPSRAAYLSAAIFIAASGGINVQYGYAKGAGDPVAGIIWAGVAGAVAVVFALSWPALIRSLEARRWSAAVMALAALLIAGAYSVSAALGTRCHHGSDGHGAQWPVARALRSGRVSDY